MNRGEYIMIRRIIEFILRLFGITLEDDVNTREVTIYEMKPFMSQYERKFYNILKTLENEYTIIPQLNLASVIKKKNNNRYYTELFRNIDFAIFDKNMNKLLLLIEINDNTHKKYKRKDRDLKVKKICNDVNIKLLTFYTNYPNERNYVLNRIRKVL